MRQAGWQRTPDKGKSCGEVPRTDRHQLDSQSSRREAVYPVLPHCAWNDQRSIRQVKVTGCVTRLQMLKHIPNQHIDRTSTGLHVPWVHAVDTDINRCIAGAFSLPTHRSSNQNAATARYPRQHLLPGAAAVPSARHAITITMQILQCASRAACAARGPVQTYNNCTRCAARGCSPRCCD
jgi:hypothetical protein